jgi:restriction system protein
MPIPDYQSLFQHVLRATSDGKEHSTADIRERVATDLQLTPEDLAQKLPSGKQPIFTNRVAWATVYLSKALALDRVKRGVFKITKRGRDLLGLNLPSITNKNLAVYPEFVAFQKAPRLEMPKEGQKNPRGPRHLKSRSRVPQRYFGMHLQARYWKP